VWKAYGTDRAPEAVLERFSWSFEPERLHVVAGPSGSGKTTLLNLAAGLERPDRGEVWVGGERIDGLGPEESARWRRRVLGYVSQHSTLVGFLSRAGERRARPRVAGVRDGGEHGAGETMARVGRSRRSGRTTGGAALRRGATKGGARPRVRARPAGSRRRRANCSPRQALGPKSHRASPPRRGRRRRNGHHGESRSRSDRRSGSGSRPRRRGPGGSGRSLISRLRAPPPDRCRPPRRRSGRARSRTCARARDARTRRP
jgi:hypothetical protein